MVKIRLMRVGKKKQPSYRVVVADSRSPRDGRIIEAIGHYHPRQEPSEVVIDSERAVHWLRHGAQPSDQVRVLLKITGAWSEFTGEAAPVAGAAPSPKKATPAASIKATPAASVADEASPEDAPEGAEPAVLPEAVDQSGGAPEADTAAEDAAAVPEGDTSN
ncbi:MAG: 30S ribosomal protein S16 [Actinobacteria bacterium]|nr:30S ribosomal protein S16 [Actinomycetota bacterium]